jgi:hypothetical protein
VQQRASLATLEINAFTVKPSGISSGMYWYLPSLRLTETGGRSAAKLISMTFALPGGDSFVIRGPGCFLAEKSDVVDTGQTWDLTSVYLYCLYIDSPVSLSGGDLDVSVYFTDQNGLPGTITASTRIH